MNESLIKKKLYEKELLKQILLPNFEFLTILKNYLFKRNSLYSQARLGSFRDRIEWKGFNKLAREWVQIDTMERSFLSHV